jgi:PAS domain S-box-containing protein
MGDLLLKSIIEYDKIMDSISDWITIINTDLKIKYSNDSCKNIINLSKKDVIDKCCCKLIHNLDNPPENCPINKMFKSKKTEKTEIHLKENNKWYSVVVNPIFDNNKNIIAAVHIVRDITDKKKTEEELKISYDRLIKSQNIAKIGNWEWDIKNDKLWWSNELYKIFGIKKDEFKLSFENIVNIIHPDDRDNNRKIVDKLLKIGGAYTIEFRILQTNGKIKWAKEIINTIRDKSGNVVTAEGTIQDITNLKKSQEELKKRQEIFKDIVETAPSLLIITNKMGINLYVSPNSKEYTGYTPDELMGSNKWWVHPNDFKKTKYMFERIYKESISGKNIEYKAIKKNGDVWYASSSWAPLRDRNGNFNGIIMQTVDITDKKLKEINLKRKLMKFNLEEGHVYIITNKEKNSKITVINELHDVGYFRYIISRYEEEQIKSWIKGPYKYRRFTEIKTKYSLKPNIVTIKKYVQNKPKKSVILIERLDYLITKNNFKKVLELVQYLNENAYLNNQIIVISVDLSILKPVEKKLLLKETKNIELQSKIKLPEDMLEILKLIYNYNIKGEKPSHIDIVKALGLSKPTIYSKIKELSKYGYIKIETSGRNRKSEITDKTRTLLG